MNITTRSSILASAALLALVLSGTAQAQQAANMTFFVTSTPVGKGGDLGGLEGADAHCQQLAQSVGAGGHTWHAYLSSSTSAAMVGHVDRRGNADTVFQHSWSSAHMSRGCTQPDLIATGGNGLLYCFATN